MTNRKAGIIALLALTAALLGGCLGNKPQLTEHAQKIQDLNERALDSATKGYDADAQKLLQEALQRASAQDDQDGISLTLLNQSRLARHAGNLQQAATLVEQALAASAGTGRYADVAQEKALQELQAGHLKPAEKWAETARSHEAGPLMGRRLNLLARIALQNGNRQQAAQLAEQALSATNAAGLELERANALRILGSIKARERQFSKAEKLLQEALALDKQLTASSKIAADLEALAELAGLQGELTRQQQYLQRAKMVRENDKTSKKH